MRYVFSPVNGTTVRRRACITETVLSVTIKRIASKLSLCSNTGGSALNWPEGYGSPGTGLWDSASHRTTVNFCVRVWPLDRSRRK